MAGNIIVQSNHDDSNHAFYPESQNRLISPTICLTGPRAVQQGIPPTLRSEASHVKLTFDYYTGNDDALETGRFYKVEVRSMGTDKQPQGPQTSAWSTFAAPGLDWAGFPDSVCWRFDPGNYWEQYGDIDLASTDSLQVAIRDQVRCARFGAAACGQARGGYIDNIRVVFVRDQPFTGVEPGAPTLDFVRGAYPNPSADGSATVLFSLRQALPVSIRFYDLRGALVHEAQIDAHPGENRYRWGGVSDRGSAVGSGIYFYRLFADSVEFRNNEQRVVFVGRREN
jgi:hypothetical protein